MSRGTKLAWLNRDIWPKLRTKRRVYDFLKEQVMQKDYKDVSRLCFEVMQEGNEKSQTLTRNCLNTAVKDNKTCSINTLETKGGPKGVLTIYWIHRVGG